MDYYHHHSRAYFQETAALDPGAFLTPFVRYLPDGARVLDVGCGSGRDLRWLEARGFAAVGLERSAGLADLAGKHSGCRVITGDFERFDFAGLAVDALLLCGSLVHTPHHRLGGVLRRMLPALGGAACSGSSGWVYLSLKEGRGERTDDRGRVFYYWQARDLESALVDCGLEVLDFRKSLSADGAGTIWLGYVLKAPVI